METLNIVNLIERNPLTKISKDYQNKLVNKLQEHFTNDQQQLFIASFYCYLNYNPVQDFVINLDDVWKWVGFSRKDHAKRLFEKHFIKDIDYKIISPQPRINIQAGRPQENITMTINTFKSFCLKANTKKSHEIHKYYIKLEEILFEVVNEETAELRLQLERKDELLKKSSTEIEKLNNILHKRNKPQIITNEKFVVYLLVAYINGKTIYIIGMTADINKRYRTYKLKGILIPEQDIKLVYYKCCRNINILRTVESCVILKFSENLIDGKKEIFEFDDTKTEEEIINNFKDVIDFYVNSFASVSSNIVIKEVKNEEEKKEDTRIRTELYTEANRNEINEKVRIDRQENPEKYAEREKRRDPDKKKAKNKRYYENHKEEIAVKTAEYRENNKEKITERTKEYYEEHKDERLEYLKNYRQENKDKIKKQKTQKIKCCICLTELTKQCWKVHSTSQKHSALSNLYPERQNIYEIIDTEN
jgi:hypothetical protein